MKSNSHLLKDGQVLLKSVAQAFEELPRRRVLLLDFGHEAPRAKPFLDERLGRAVKAFKSLSSLTY